MGIFLLIGALALIVSVALVVRYSAEKSEFESYSSKSKVPPKFERGWFIVFVVVSIYFLVCGGYSTVVGPREIAVVENVMDGQIYSIKSGVHIFPFSTRVVPFVTKAVKYTLVNQVIEIGASPAGSKGVSADSNSTGRPVVYFWARGWARLNPDKVIEIHKKFSTTYLDSWVESVWVSTLKSIQGGLPYDYVGNNRIQFQDTVEKALQLELLDTDGVPLVFVSQLSVADYDYTKATNEFMAGVQAKEFLRQQAVKEIEINSQKQLAAQIEADTAYNVAKRLAESQALKTQLEAEGSAKATKVRAEAEAYAISQKYQAEADGVALVNKAVSITTPIYLQYLLANRWSGQYPQTLVGDSDFLLTLPIK